MTTKVRFLNVDDWSGVYINDKLVDEGHRVNPHELMLELAKVLDIDFDSVWMDDLHKYNDACPTEWQEEFNEQKT